MANLTFLKIQNTARIWLPYHLQQRCGYHLSPHLTMSKLIVLLISSEIDMQLPERGQ